MLNTSNKTEELLLFAEQLQEQVEQLKTANESLELQLAASEQARIAAESQIMHLSAIVESNAEDLQLFGGHWFRPSAVTSITCDQVAIYLNGTPIGEASAPQVNRLGPEMARIAQLINDLNTERRQQAQR